MSGETQVELSHTCFGTDCDLFALLSLVWNSRRTWHTAGTGASETTWVRSICAGLLFGPLTTLGWHSKIIHEIYEHRLQWWCANGMALAKQSQSESRICPVIHMWAVLVINLLLLQFVNSNTDKYEKKKKKSHQHANLILDPCLSVQCKGLRHKANDFQLQTHTSKSPGLL